MPELSEEQKRIAMDAEKARSGHLEQGVDLGPSALQPSFQADYKRSEQAEQVKEMIAPDAMAKIVEATHMEIPGVALPPVIPVAERGLMLARLISNAQAPSGRKPTDQGGADELQRQLEELYGK